MTTTIRTVQASDAEAWQALWSGYLQFYQTQLSTEQTNHTWQRILDPSSAVHSVVAVQTESHEPTKSSSEVITGFANYIIHENTWEMAPVCYLEDLFVDTQCRAKGVGKQLLEWLQSEAKQQEWSRLYWHTQENNYRARALYDQYAAHNGFVRYVAK